MTLSTDLTRMFNIKAPVILAPMAGVSGGALAAAVSNAGGLGFIGGGYADADWAMREMDIAGDVRIGIGFITWALERNPALLDAVLERQPEAIFLSFGDGFQYYDVIKKQNVKLIVQVQNLAKAHEAVRHGADLIVAQGCEAGGHGGQRSMGPLVREIICNKLGVPVIAAGGVADGESLAASLVLGACGAVCGTIFYTAEEALSHPKAKARVITATGDETVRSSLFDIVRKLDWPLPWTLRTLQNSFSREWMNAILASNVAQRTFHNYETAVANGDFDTAAVIIGEAVGLIRESQSAAYIFRTLMHDAEETLLASNSLITRDEGTLL